MIVMIMADKLQCVSKLEIITETIDLLLASIREKMDDLRPWMASMSSERDGPL